MRTAFFIGALLVSIHTQAAVVYRGGGETYATERIDHQHIVEVRQTGNILSILQTSNQTRHPDINDAIKLPHQYVICEMKLDEKRLLQNEVDSFIQLLEKSDRFSFPCNGRIEKTTVRGAPAIKVKDSVFNLATWFEFRTDLPTGQVLAEFNHQLLSSGHNSAAIKAADVFRMNVRPNGVNIIAGDRANKTLSEMFLTKATLEGMGFTPWNFAERIATEPEASIEVSGRFWGKLTLGGGNGPDGIYTGTTEYDMDSVFKVNSPRKAGNEEKGQVLAVRAATCPDGSRAHYKLIHKFNDSKSVAVTYRLLDDMMTEIHTNLKTDQTIFEVSYLVESHKEENFLFAIPVNAAFPSEPMFGKLPASLPHVVLGKPIRLNMSPGKRPGTRMIKTEGSAFSCGKKYHDTVILEVIEG